MTIEPAVWSADISFGQLSIEHNTNAQADVMLGEGLMRRGTAISINAVGCVSTLRDKTECMVV